MCVNKIVLTPEKSPYLKIYYGYVRKIVTLSITVWTQHLFDLALNCIKTIVVIIPAGTNCVPPVSDLLSFCHERDFMLSLFNDNQDEVI